MPHVPDNALIRVVAAILQRDGKILIARRKAGKSFAGKWEFPGGKIEPGESPEAALRRELKEEFSIEASVESYLGTSRHSYPLLTVELIAYTVRYEGGSFVLSEHDELRWVKKEDLPSFDMTEADLPLIELL
jgi:8-oxo-dGTP diphosphatase